VGESRPKDRVKTGVTLPINLLFGWGLKTSQIQSNGPQAYYSFDPPRFPKNIFIPNVFVQNFQIIKCCGTIPKFLKLLTSLRKAKS
jgi:hypothetical protein